MTRQVVEGQPITVVARSQVGGFIPDAAVTVDGDVYADPNCSERHDETRTNGAGEFVFYATAGTVITVTVDDPIAVDLEPIQVVGVEGRPGGLAAVHPDDTPEVHEQSPVSELVSDASLVGAPSDRLPEEDGGAAALVGLDAAQNVPPAPVEGEQYPQTPQEALDAQTAPTPSGDGASDPDAVTPPAGNEEQVTPQFEPVPDDTTHMEPAPETSAGTSGTE